MKTKFLDELVEADGDNSDGLFIVAYVTEVETPEDDPSDFELQEHWGVAHGFANAQAQLFDAQLGSCCGWLCVFVCCVLCVGVCLCVAVFVCVLSGEYCTADESLNRKEDK